MSALPAWLQYVSVVGQFLILVVLVPIVRALWTIRENDLDHIFKAITSVEGKLDGHISWHLNQKKKDSM